MPEGNAIHRFARAQTRDFAGRRVRVTSAQRRFAAAARRLNGRIFLAAEARGKHLFHHWEGGILVHVHLGMFGWFYRYTGRPPGPRPTLRMRLSTAEVAHDLIGPPTCELITPEERERTLARLGPDPLDPRADAERFRAELSSRGIPIGHALIDQRIAAGVGNIYRAEALHVTGIHPLRPARSLSDAETARLWETLRAMMRRGARRDSTSTVPLEDLEPEERRTGLEGFYVYQREHCRGCGGKIRRLPLSGRILYVCERCQSRRARHRVPP